MKQNPDSSLPQTCQRSTRQKFLVYLFYLTIFCLPQLLSHIFNSTLHSHIDDKISTSRYVKELRDSQHIIQSLSTRMEQLEKNMEEVTAQSKILQTKLSKSMEEVSQDKASAGEVSVSIEKLQKSTEEVLTENKATVVTVVALTKRIDDLSRDIATKTLLSTTVKEMKEEIAMNQTTVMDIMSQRVEEIKKRAYETSSETTEMVTMLSKTVAELTQASSVDTATVVALTKRIDDLSRDVATKTLLSTTVKEMKEEIAMNQTTVMDIMSQRVEEIQKRTYEASSETTEIVTMILSKTVAELSQASCSVSTAKDSLKEQQRSNDQASLIGSIIGSCWYILTQSLYIAAQCLFGMICIILLIDFKKERDRNHSPIEIIEWLCIILSAIYIIYFAPLTIVFGGPVYLICRCFGIFIPRP